MIRGVADHTPRRAASPRWAAWRKRYALVSDILTPQRIGLLLLLVVLLGTGLLGGWQDALTGDADDLPAVEPSASATAAPFTWVVKKAFSGDELKPAAYPRDGVRYLFVTVDATNTSDLPTFASLLTGAAHVEVPGIATQARPTVVRVLDGQAARAFSPDVAVPVVLVWEQDAAQPAPERVTVTVDGHTFRRSTMDASTEWRDPVPAFTVTLPVEEVPAA